VELHGFAGHVSAPKAADERLRFLSPFGSNPLPLQQALKPLGDAV
jgi:hypothetical protein